jgi:hypothetical protein
MAQAASLSLMVGLSWIGRDYNQGGLLHQHRRPAVRSHRFQELDAEWTSAQLLWPASLVLFPVGLNSQISLSHAVFFVPVLTHMTLSLDGHDPKALCGKVSRQGSWKSVTQVANSVYPLCTLLRRICAILTVHRINNLRNINITFSPIPAVPMNCFRASL